MKLVSIQEPNHEPWPAASNDGSTAWDLRPAGYATAQAFIAGGAEALAAVGKLIASGPGFSLAGYTLGAPLPRPPRIFAIGLNYRDHAAETGMAAQAVPTVFMKLASSVTGPNTDIILPKLSREPDYEAELAVVIGKGGRHIAAADWQQHVFGYTILNDVSARDIQFSTSQWTLSKSFPTFTPMGPWIVTADEIRDPHALDLSLSIDGETLQQSNTSELIFRIPELISYLSSILPLEPGDILSTGTPAGVGLGRDPKRWLKPGEEIVIRIDGIGELRNRTIAEENQVSHG